MKDPLIYAAVAVLAGVAAFGAVRLSQDDAPTSHRATDAQTDAPTSGGNQVTRTTLPDAAHAGRRIAAAGGGGAPAAAIDLMRYLRGQVPEAEWPRWELGISLAEAVRMARFSSASTCAGVPPSVHVRWRVRGGDTGMAFRDPVVTTTVPTDVAACLTRALSDGVTIDPIELGGPLTETSFSVVVAVPTVLAPDMRAHLDEVEAAIRARRDEGQNANGEVDLE